MSANDKPSRILPVAICLAAMALSSCASKPKSPAGPVKIETFAEESGGVSFGGETVTDMTATNATIISIDASLRTLGLKYPNGTRVTYQAGKEAANFDQFKVGAQVQTTLIRALTVAPAPAGMLPGSAGTFSRASGVVLGAMPVQTVSFTAKILAFDPIRRRITLQSADGRTRSVKVRDEVSLGNVNVGDTVSVRVTEALAVELAKP